MRVLILFMIVGTSVVSSIYVAHSGATGGKKDEKIRNVQLQRHETSVGEDNTDVMSKIRKSGGKEDNKGYMIVSQQQPAINVAKISSHIRDKPPSNHKHPQPRPQQSSGTPPEKPNEKPGSIADKQESGNTEETVDPPAKDQPNPAWLGGWGKGWRKGWGKGWNKRWGRGKLFQKKIGLNQFKKNANKEESSELLSGEATNSANATVEVKAKSITKTDENETTEEEVDTGTNADEKEKDKDKQINVETGKKPKWSWSKYWHRPGRYWWHHQRRVTPKPKARWFHKW